MRQQILDNPSVSESTYNCQKKTPKNHPKYQQIDHRESRKGGIPTPIHTVRSPRFLECILHLVDEFPQSDRCEIQTLMSLSSSEFVFEQCTCSPVSFHSSICQKSFADNVNGLIRYTPTTNTGGDYIHAQQQCKRASLEKRKEKKTPHESHQWNISKNSEIAKSAFSTCVGTNGVPSIGGPPS